MFALIHNGQIEVGPRQWRFQIFAEYLEEQGLGEEVSLLTHIPPTAILTGTNWQILPARVASSEPYHSIFEQPVGPSWVITPTEVIGTYTKTDASLSMAKSKLLELVREARFHNENSFIDITIEDVMVRIPTDRETRSVFAVGIPGKWKFKYVDSLITPRESNMIVGGDIWVTVTADILYTIRTAIQTYVQECFNWEARLTYEIQTATTLTALRDINMKFDIGSSNA